MTLRDIIAFPEGVFRPPQAPRSEREQSDQRSFHEKFLSFLPHAREKQEKPPHRLPLWKAIAICLAVLPALSALPDAQGDTMFGRVISSSITTALSYEGQEAAFQTEQEFMERAGDTENENYKPYLDSLKDGVEEFQQKHPDVPVTWRLSSEYVSDIEALSALTSPITEEELKELRMLSKKYKKLIGQSPFALAMELTTKTNDDESGNLLFKIIMQRFPQRVRDQLGAAKDSTTQLPDSDETSDHENPEKAPRFVSYDSIKADLQKIYENQAEKKPLPTSVIISYLLEKNGGDLNASMLDLAGFMKHMIRGNDNIKLKNLNWVQTHIQDEVNKKFSFNSFLLTKEDFSTDEGKNLISAMGLLYHRPHMNALSYILSPALNRLAVVYEMKAHKHLGEDYKEMVDYEDLNQLEKLQDYLNEFSVN